MFWTVAYAVFLDTFWAGCKRWTFTICFEMWPLGADETLARASLAKRHRNLKNALGEGENVFSVKARVTYFAHVSQAR